MKTRYIASLLLISFGLSGCVEESTTTTTRTGSASDEAACVSAVAAQTGNSVVVQSSDFSQANTEVRLAVGPQAAPWRCLVSGGVVAEVTSLTNEGTL
jgi:hypothetical protein